LAPLGLTQPLSDLVCALERRWGVGLVRRGIIESGMSVTGPKAEVPDATLRRRQKQRKYVQSDRRGTRRMAARAMEYRQRRYNVLCRTRR
jgi:hypothetical protein